MRSLLNKIHRDLEGVAALEFALFLPLLLLLTVGLLEVGRAYYQAQALDKGIRAGALYAAYMPEPFSAATKTAVENLVRTGNPAGSGAYLVSGFADSAAKVELTSLSYDLGGTPVPVVRVAAEVPFDPLLPGMKTVFDASAFKIRLSHEQAYIGP